MRVRQHFIFQQSLQEAIRYVSKRVYPFKKARIKKQCNCKSVFSLTPKRTKSSACTKSKVSWSNNRRGDQIPRYFTTIAPFFLLIQSVRKVFWYCDVFRITCRRHTSRAKRTSLPEDTSRSACGTHRWKKPVTFVTGFFLAPRAGLEPATSWLTVMRSTDWANEEYFIRLEVLFFLTAWALYHKKIHL